jgi:diguanylate cyclase (GGDEF)-like protein/PAS domain S-box-containing protein
MSLLTSMISKTLLLLLLVVFFWTQQRRRPQIYYRYWCAGWIGVLLSYGVWLLPLSRPGPLPLQEALRFDLLLLGALAFVKSFLASTRTIRQTVWSGLSIALPAFVAVDLQQVGPMPAWVFLLCIVLGQAAALRAILTVTPRQWRRVRPAILTICVFFAGWMLLRVVQLAAGDMGQLILAELMFCSGVFYVGTYPKAGISRFLGALGFFGWGGFYAATTIWPEGGSTMLLLSTIWEFPKYFVGFSMILRVFEDAADEEARLLEELGRRYEDFRLLYEGHPHSMILCEPVTGKLLSVNAAFVAASGFSNDELLQRCLNDLEMPRDAELEEMAMALPPAESSRLTRLRSKNGDVVWVTVSKHGIQFLGQEAQLLTIRDITQAIRFQRQLVHRAHHDALTGLPNRQLLADRLKQCMDRCEREQRRAAVFTVDIDHFKRVNDTYGHPVGDECLKAVAQRLSSRIRQIDTLARTGGEEFTAVIGGLSGPRDAEKIAQSLLAVFQTPVQLGEIELAVTVSIGVAMYPENGMDAESLQKRSDEALYRAKQSGRDRAEYCWSSLVALPVG